MKMKTLCFAIATAIAVPSAAMASPNAADKKAAPARELTAAEQVILQHRHHVNVMEIDMGKLALQNGTDATKKYGQMLVTDHSKADADVKTLAKLRKVKLTDHPTNMSPAEKAEHDTMMEKMARLKTLKGADFDREFVPQMVEGHEKEFARVSGEVGTVSDAKLKALLEKTLPSLRKHADEAKKLMPAAAPGAPPAPGTVTPRSDASPPAPRRDPASPTKPGATPPTKPVPPSGTRPAQPAQPAQPKATPGQQSSIDPKRDLMLVLK